MNEQQKKQMQITAKILEVINELINEDDTVKKMIDEDLTDFIHVITNHVPTMIFNRMTGDDKNLLQVNHIANQLCFQYMKKDEN